MPLTMALRCDMEGCRGFRPLGPAPTDDLLVSTRMFTFDTGWIVLPDGWQMDYDGKVSCPAHVATA
jgi:hypothetical protein